MGNWAGKQEKIMAEQYRVVISGRTLSGEPLAGIRGEVGRVFRLQGEQLDRMLCGKPVVVARSVAAEAAEKLLARLHSVDLEARAESLAETAEASPAALAKPENALPPASDELFALVQPVAPVRPAAVGETGQAESSPADTVVCPKCGESQPKRTLCRQCGLDMPRFLAAQEAVEREARETRAAELTARRPGSGASPRASDGSQASLLGLGFSGRLGRLDYFSSSLLSTAFWILMVVLAVAADKNAFAGLGVLISVIYSVRCLALRLHDTGRTGWLALIVVVPVIGALMAFFLLFIRGDDDENEYGEPPMSTGGGRAIFALVTVIAASSLLFRGITESPDKAARFLQALSVGQGKEAPEEAAEDDVPQPGVQARYASNNRIDIYVIAGCTDCEKMSAWLSANGLRPTVYSVDSDQQAAERLHSILGSNGQIQLPVLEVNGKVLSANPDVGEVHRHLRQET